MRTMEFPRAQPEGTFFCPINLVMYLKSKYKKINKDALFVQTSWQFSVGVAKGYHLNGG